MSDLTAYVMNHHGDDWLAGEIERLQAELDALKAQNAKPVVIIRRNMSGQIVMQTIDGNSFDVSQYVGASLYTTPPTLEQAIEDFKKRAVESLINALGGL